MKCMLFILMLLLTLSVQAAFLAGTDIPAVDDMIVDENDSFSFDTPAGQIMTIAGKTKLSPKELKNFYKESLTALGWKVKSATTFSREQDELILQPISFKNGYTLFKVQLTFANK